MGVLTISASYAAGGSEIAPDLAKRLGLPFIDRAIPVSVAQRLGVPVDTVDAVVDDPPSRFWSLMASMAVVPDYLGTSSQANVALPSERELREQIERELVTIADDGGGVVLGRAAALVLANRPDALHVRLDGPVEGRIQAAMRQHGIDEKTAREACKASDLARSSYVRHFYHADSAAPQHYHLVIDTVALGWAAATDLICLAAQRRGVSAAGCSG